MRVRWSACRWIPQGHELGACRLHFFNWCSGPHLLLCVLVLPPLSLGRKHWDPSIKSSCNYRENKVFAQLNCITDLHICCDWTRVWCFILWSLAGAWGKIWVTVYLLLLSLCISPLLRIHPLFHLHLSNLYPCLSLSNLGTRNNTNSVLCSF